MFIILKCAMLWYEARKKESKFHSPRMPLEEEYSKPLLSILCLEGVTLSELTVRLMAILFPVLALSSPSSHLLCCYFLSDGTAGMEGNVVNNSFQYVLVSVVAQCFKLFKHMLAKEL